MTDPCFRLRASEAAAKLRRMRSAAAGRWAATIALAFSLGAGRAWPDDQPSEKPPRPPAEEAATEPQTQPTEQPAARPPSQPAAQPPGQPPAQPPEQPPGAPSEQAPSPPPDQPADQPSEQAPEARPGHVIRYAKDMLTVRLAKVPVTDVLAEIGRQSGAEVRGQVRDPRDVSAEFDDVPLPDALHRLLGSQNFALIYADGARLRAVKLLGGPQAAPAPAPAGAPPVAPPPPPPIATSPAALIGMLERHAPVPVTGRLAEIFGADSATFMQLVDAGLHNEDPVVRLEAVRAAIQGIEGDGELRGALVGAASSIDIGELSMLVRSAAGDHADEITMNVATQAHATEIRTKASALLQQLRRPRGG